MCKSKRERIEALETTVANLSSEVRWLKEEAQALLKLIHRESRYVAVYTETVGAVFEKLGWHVRAKWSKSSDYISATMRLAQEGWEMTSNDDDWSWWIKKVCQRTPDAPKKRLGRPPKKRNNR